VCVGCANTLDRLVARSVDKSLVVVISKHLSEIDVSKGAMIKIKRTDKNVCVCVPVCSVCLLMTAAVGT
jgi:hypothetical protein